MTAYNGGRHSRELTRAAATIKNFKRDLKTT